MNLKNKKVLITGATGGIGNSLLQKFNELGATILATGTNEEKLANIKKNFPKVEVESFKLQEHDKIEKFVENVEKKLDGLDILVNNAGILRDKSFHKITTEEFDQVMDVHFQGSFYAYHEVYPIMREQNFGRIIFTT